MRLSFYTIGLGSFLLCGCIRMDWRGGTLPHLEIVREKKTSELHSALLSSDFILQRKLEDWPQFRGPQRDGTANPQNANIDWTILPTQVWRRSIGEGHSSVIVGSNTILTFEQKGELECLTARSANDGHELWKVCEKNRWNDSFGGVGPRSTPTLINGKVFALFTNGMLHCVNLADGKELWKEKVIEENYVFPEWGISCSPLVWKNHVILNLGGQKSAAQARSITSGELIWTSDLVGKSAYLSPSILEFSGKKHLIVGIEGKIAGLDPISGKTLWEHPWKIFLNNVQIAQPLKLFDNSFLLSAGYGKGAERISVKKSGDHYLLETVWKTKNLKAKFSNPVTRNGFIYGMSENTLVCLDALNGSLMWRGNKYGYGRVLLAEDKILILGNTGKLSVVEANPNEFVEISSSPLLSKVRCWNGPALVNGYLIARNGEELAFFDWSSSL